MQNTCWLLLECLVLVACVLYWGGRAGTQDLARGRGVTGRRGHERAGRAGAGSGSGGEWVAAGG
jgi:hypothetical protein